MKKLCPKCRSADVKIHEDDGISFITCNSCGYDELEEYEDLGKKTSQNEKGRYSPYKTGGKGRSRK